MLLFLPPPARILTLGVVLAAALLTLPADGAAPGARDARRRAEAILRPEALRAHMAFLADDLLQGRGTGSPGFDLAALYVASEFEGAGLRPAGEGGSWLQAVPLRRATLVGSGCSFVLEGGRGRPRRLEYGADYLYSADAARESSSVAAPLVYAGFGVTAPEFGYDDYSGIDVSGKVVVLLRGAPSTFPHNERAFYSRYRAKAENAVKRGAVGILSFRSPHDAERFPWAKSIQLNALPSLEWLDEDGTPHGVFPELAIGGTLSPRGVETMFGSAPVTLAEAMEAADAGRPRSFDLGVQARLRRRSRHAETTSPNVLGLLEGSDPDLRQEVVVYTAHLDHLGVGDPLDGDRIYNGAYDNASGVAMLIETARAFASLPAPPRRSILFLAVTGEEAGMLGSEYFSEHPTLPLEGIVADLNLDMILMLAPIHDVVAFGAEHSTLGGVVERAARSVGMTLVPDPHPEEVIFVRSDQFSFVSKGIPSVFPVSSQGDLETAWMRDVYHTQRDDMAQPMDLESGARFALMNFLAGYEVAQARKRPRWNPGDFFGDRFAGARSAGTAVSR